VEVKLHTFLTSALDEGGQLLIPDALPLKKEPSGQQTVGAKASLDMVAKKKASPLSGIKPWSSSL
jgi:hypothetical protein